MPGTCRCGRRANPLKCTIIQSNEPILGCGRAGTASSHVLPARVEIPWTTLQAIRPPPIAASRRWRLRAACKRADPAACENRPQPHRTPAPAIAHRRIHHVKQRITSRVYTPIVCPGQAGLVTKPGFIFQARLAAGMPAAASASSPSRSLRGPRADDQSCGHLAALEVWSGDAADGDAPSAAASARTFIRGARSGEGKMPATARGTFRQGPRMSEASPSPPRRARHRPRQGRKLGHMRYLAVVRGKVTIFMPCIVRPRTGRGCPAPVTCFSARLGARLALQPGS